MNNDDDLEESQRPAREHLQNNGSLLLKTGEPNFGVTKKIDNVRSSAAFAGEESDCAMRLAVLDS